MTPVLSKMRFPRRVLFKTPYNPVLFWTVVWGILDANLELFTLGLMANQNQAGAGR